ncbi:excitatory amino acid transporter 3-like [Phlebotomus argentipes]|uniref:excitatory amino acid transporter 3-like n=1 Tax=Phlebotomus argentipes TaxID=94469 RepID=UPI00289351B5|nr:excitatory amino acid transporter 3-like [Phlebotomus argentipes]
MLDLTLFGMRLLSVEIVVSRRVDVLFELRKMAIDEKKPWVRKNLMLVLTLMGVAAGVLLGFSLKALHLNTDYIAIISYPGEVFMSFLKMIILPLLTSCLIYGTASLNIGANGKIAIRTLTYIIFSSFIAVSIGLCLVVLIKPGVDTTSERSISEERNCSATSEVNLLDTFLDLGRNLVPNNLFRATFQQAYTAREPKNVILFRDGTNSMGIVFFCFLLGGVLGTLGERGKVAIDFFQGILEATLKIVRAGMWMAPLGVCSIIAGKILEVENLNMVMLQIGKFIVTVCLGQAIYQLIILQSYYYIIIRKNPFKFYVKLVDPIISGIVTCSTVATLPITLRALNDKARINPRVTRFVLPLGCSMNTDGAAMYMIMASGFLAQMQGIDLKMGELGTLLVITTILSLAIGSVPSGAVMLVTIILSSINASGDQITLLFTVEWFLDRVRTPNNILTDCYAAAIVDYLSMKELQKEVIEEEGVMLQSVEVEKAEKLQTM